MTLSATGISESILLILVGHLAKAQIPPTYEHAADLADFSITLGWILLVISCLFLVVWAVLGLIALVSR